MKETGTGPSAVIDAAIPIGEAAQIQVENKKYSTVIRGIVPPRWVLLDMPKKDGRLISLPRGKAVLIRYIHQGIMFGFRAIVNHEYLAPSQILVVDFPKAVEERNLRRSERIKTFIPIRIAFEDETEPEGGAMMDLSREGALLFFEGDFLPEVGETVWISLKLPGGAAVERLGCLVRNSREPRNLRLVGVEFETENRKSLEAIQSFYDYCLSPMG